MLLRWHADWAYVVELAAPGLVCTYTLHCGGAGCYTNNQVFTFLGYRVLPWSLPFQPNNPKCILALNKN